MTFHFIFELDYIGLQRAQWTIVDSDDTVKFLKEHYDGLEIELGVIGRMRDDMSARIIKIYLDGTDPNHVTSGLTIGVVSNQSSISFTRKPGIKGLDNVPESVEESPTVSTILLQKENENLRKMLAILTKEVAEDIREMIFKDNSNKKMAFW